MSLLLGVIGGLGLAMGAGSMLKGANDQRKAAAANRAEIARQRAANEAWYARNYYRDYLNTVQAQNAMKKVRQAWADEVQKSRGRQAVTGGTAEQAAAVAEVGGKAIANTIGDLAAKGEQDKRAIDAQKQAFDAGISEQRQQMYAQEQAAGANMFNNGLGLAISGAQALAAGLSAPKAPTPTATPTATPTTATTDTTNALLNNRAIIGKEAGINPELFDVSNPVDEYMYYTKNPEIRL